MSVPWLADLEVALWAQLPQEDPAFEWDGETVLCQRTLEEREEGVYFVETWHHPRTRVVLNTWRMALKPGAWVGLPPALQARMIELLVAGLTQARPIKTPRSERAVFNPTRLAHQPQQEGLEWRRDL